MTTPREEAITGCLLGTAVGDALGLWCEGMSARRQRRFHTGTGYHFLFGRGMTSDDTEHACMTAQALIVSAGDERAFLRSLAWRLRFWLLGLPAGIGRATLRAALKLWLGFPARSSGVFSAGNGPAMRSPLLGVCHGHDLPTLRKLVRASTRLTHRDPKAEHGALAVALAAHLASTPSETAGLATEYLARLKEALGEEGADLLALAERAAASAAAGEPPEAFASALGLKRGVTGYMYHTVPMVLQAWLRWPEDYRAAVAGVIGCGGDTDTTAAIVGGIVGARVGKAGIPAEWLARLWEWPRTVRWLGRLGQRLAAVCASGAPGRPVRLFVPGLFARNLFFLAVVLLHALRRLLPPY
jgi:ADP-ribosyl-[dinitrogen reductase] hydrolase